MATQLTICTNEELCAVIQFLWGEGVRGVEIQQRLSAQYSDSVLPISVDVHPDRSSPGTFAQLFLTCPSIFVLMQQTTVILLH
jgi:hypothetical protein